VESRTLDSFCDEQGVDRIDFLKIDVEGYERHVLAGAARLLDEGAISVLSFEISQIPLKASGVRPREIFELLERAGYAAFELADGGFTGPVHDSSAYYANYYASRDDLTRIRIE
jgi:hypothetical protein